ncbi:MAG TPA: acetate kinase [Dehalococcoidia bacterium]|nr:acetate kinase [Dehalococcoidia bacterium]
MKVLVLNCGSSTLKFELFNVAESGPDPISRLALGLADRIGQDGMLDFAATNGQTLREPTTLADHGEAARQVLAWLDSTGLDGADAIGAVGHRVVHGGDRFSASVIITDNVIAGIREVTQLAPLHNGPSLQAIGAVEESLGASVPMVAVFDTAYHRTMPQVASRYAIPSELADQHHIQRYGFHGIAHRYMAERYSAIAGRPLTDLKLVTLQLGNGCSAAAISGGRSLDTSMGFTPLEGLIMGTRSGDVDPSLPGFLARQGGVTLEEVEGWLNHRSGLLGVSGRSQDMRELLQAEQAGDARASLAIDMFCYRVRKYIGAFLAVLGGADAVVFGGGIGERAPVVRQRICTGMDWCGLVLDPAGNADAKGKEGHISAESSRIDAWVIPVDEAAIILRETLGCLAARRGS